MPRQYEKRKGKERPLCYRCKKIPVAAKGKYKDGSIKYGKVCHNCKHIIWREKLLIDLKCIRCGFNAENSSQLDIDHIDGNRSNNSRENLQILCPTCHRIKTLENGDHLHKNN